MKYTKSLWPNWDPEHKDATISLYDEVYIQYDDFFIADGYVSDIIHERGEVEVTLQYLHNFDDKERAVKEFKSHCLEFPEGVTRNVNPINITFIAGEGETDD